MTDAPTTHPADEAMFLWVAGELAMKAAAELEAHVDGCRSCARRLTREAQLEVQLLELARPMRLAVAGSAEVTRRVPTPVSVRARRERQHRGVLGKLRLLVRERPRVVGVMAAAAAALLVAVPVGMSLRSRAVQVGPLADQSRKKFPLGETADQRVYGLGEHLGVNTPTQSEVRFEFEYSDSVPTAYYLRFESMGIEKREEVEIVLNGVRIGSVTPGMGDYTKEQRVKLPKKYLKSGIPNELLFDQSYNPPSSEPWALADVRLLVTPLPNCSPAECLREAKKLHDFAEGRWSQLNISAANAFEAWSALNKAMLYLEAALYLENVERKPDLYNLVQQFLRDAERTLDSNCNKTMLGAKKYEEMHQLDLALKEYKNGLQWFPTDEHPCRARLKEKIEEFGDAGEPAR